MMRILPVALLALRHRAVAAHNVGKAKAPHLCLARSGTCNTDYGNPATSPTKRSGFPPPARCFPPSDARGDRRSADHAISGGDLRLSALPCSRRAKRDRVLPGGARRQPDTRGLRSRGRLVFVADSSDIWE
jgi:hypothetical protein